MKRCPKCNRVEADEALKFCRVDGATLISDSGMVGGEASAAKFVAAAVSAEIETSVRGEKDQALEWLEKGIKTPPVMGTGLKLIQCFDNLRTDSGLTHFVKRVGLPQ